jgi:hypothetical protein
VLVVVVAVRRMPVPVMGVIDVIAMRDRLMPAVRAMHMDVTCMGQVRQRMLVVVAIVRRVGVPFVDVVDVPFALGARVPAAGPVSVLMQVNVMLLVCHGSSLL